MYNYNKWRNWNNRMPRKSPIKRIRVTDKVTAKDQRGTLGGIGGEVIFGKGRHVVEYINPYGQKAYRSEFEEETYKGNNIVPIGGYQFAFDKLFNIGLDQESTLRVGDLNDEAPQMKIGVQRSDYDSIHYDAECSMSDGSMTINGGINIPALNHIFGFMIGDGGAREDNVTVIAPHYTDRNLYRAIPFRMSNDGYPEIHGKYFGNVEYKQTSGIDTVISSYVKKFDNPVPHIVHVWASENKKELSIVDDTVFASTSSSLIESYIEINFSIDKSDGRGFYTTIDSSPRINEFGLVSGWYNAKLNDYESIRLFTHFTRPTISLVEDDSIEGIYRLYAR